MGFNPAERQCQRINTAFGGLTNTALYYIIFGFIFKVQCLRFLLGRKFLPWRDAINTVSKQVLREGMASFWIILANFIALAAGIPTPPLYWLAWSLAHDWYLLRRVPFGAVFNIWVRSMEFFQCSEKTAEFVLKPRWQVLSNFHRWTLGLLKFSGEGELCESVALVKGCIY